MTIERSFSAVPDIQQHCNEGVSKLHVDGKQEALRLRITLSSRREARINCPALYGKDVPDNVRRIWCNICTQVLINRARKLDSEREKRIVG